MKAYITLLSTNEYLDGVLALDQSLKNVGSKYPLVVALTGNIEPFIRNIFKLKKIEMIELEEYSFPIEYKKRFSAFGTKHWYYTSNKLKIFGLTQFEKLVFLDSDMLVLKNIDHLFNYPHMTAAQDSPMIAKENIEKHLSLNSGLIVIEPSKEIEKELINLSLNTVGADQEILQLYYKNWKDNNNLHLPATYNFFAKYYQEYSENGIKIEDIYVLHFIGTTKPFHKNYYKPFKNKNFYDYFENLYFSTIKEAIKDIENFDIFNDK